MASSDSFVSFYGIFVDYCLRIGLFKVFCNDVLSLSSIYEFGYSICIVHVVCLSLTHNINNANWNRKLPNLALFPTYPANAPGLALFSSRVMFVLCFIWFTWFFHVLLCFYSNLCLYTKYAAICKCRRLNYFRKFSYSLT